MKGFPTYVSHSPGPAVHFTREGFAWAGDKTQHPVRTAFDDRMFSSPPPGVEPGSMTIDPQGPYQTSYHIPSRI
ncbi:LOW QUALITY PROTEIN: hypothetical protein HID58_054267 [Brassica napus]|uniref:Uncharacterized protein n=1 Tax=Brassica napus TaxID=3708 RepID=A0ABQ8AHC8_BRANA|nr:LOW QUALITY PROTEIN: hypothetical protein HID58_054267 [Brassica napus]